jgi:deoxynogalonate / 12-deoxyaklanonic acid monooxygenase
MAEQETSPTDVPEVRKTVTVPLSVDEAFAIFVERPIEWWPERHVFVEDRQAITIEPRVGGSYYERGADGTEATWGKIVEWDPPKRLVLTWRVGPNWRPIFDDERASLIEVEFTELSPGTTEVALTHAQLHRHGEMAELIHRALAGPSPGETLAKYAEMVARHTAAA